MCIRDRRLVDGGADDDNKHHQPEGGAQPHGELRRARHAAAVGVLDVPRVALAAQHDRCVAVRPAADRRVALVVRHARMRRGAAVQHGAVRERRRRVVPERVLEREQAAAASRPTRVLVGGGVPFDVLCSARKAAKAAYEMAGIGPEDVDLVELHDCFATAEILHYENLGLCGDGEAGKLIDDGDVALGGRIPVNVSGGLLSKGHPLGATGIANIYEVSTHLRGEAGARQVEGAKIGLTHVIGLGSACGIHVLEKAS